MIQLFSDTQLYKYKELRISQIWPQYMYTSNLEKRGCKEFKKVDNIESCAICIPWYAS
jgi:hypothetical protein